MNTTDLKQVLDKATDLFRLSSRQPALCGTRSRPSLDDLNCFLDGIDFIERFEQQTIDPKAFGGVDKLRDRARDTYRDVARHLQSITAKALPTFRTLHQTQGIDTIMKSWESLAAQNGGLDVLELVNTTLKDERVRKPLQQLGIDGALARALARAARLKLTGTVDKQGVVWNAAVGELTRSFRIPAPNPDRKRTLSDLLHADHLDWVFAAAASGAQPLILFGKQRKQRDHTAAELLLLTTFMPAHLLHQRARSLEDVGIPAYRGGDGGLSAAAIAALVFLIIALVGVATTLVGIALRTDDCAATGGDCTLADWLVAIGAVVATLGGALACEASPDCEAHFGIISSRDPHDPGRI